MSPAAACFSVPYCFKDSARKTSNQHFLRDKGIRMATLAWIFALMSFVGWIWIIVMCFQDGETLWGIGSIIIAPVALIYGIMNFGEAKIPVILLAVGIVGRIVFGVMAAGAA